MSDSLLTFGKRENKAAVEEDAVFAPKFDANGLVPVVAMDAETREPLMLAYMNEESLKMTIEIGEAVYFSRSRNELWHKGATSGHTQKVIEMLTDCDQDAIILYVDQAGSGACHTGRNSCFYRKIAHKNPDTEVGLAFTAERTFDPNAVYGKK